MELGAPSEYSRDVLLIKPDFVVCCHSVEVELEIRSRIDCVARSLVSLLTNDLGHPAISVLSNHFKNDIEVENSGAFGLHKNMAPREICGLSDELGGMDSVVIFGSAERSRKSIDLMD